MTIESILLDLEDTLIQNLTNIQSYTYESILEKASDVCASYKRIEPRISRLYIGIPKHLGNWDLDKEFPITIDLVSDSYYSYCLIKISKKLPNLIVSSGFTGQITMAPEMTPIIPDEDSN